MQRKRITDKDKQSRNVQQQKQAVAVKSLKKKKEEDSDDDMESGEGSSLVDRSKQNPSYTREGSTTIEEAYLDEFFPILELEVDKINKFYVGKCAEIKLSLDLIQVKRANWAQSHHTGNKPSDLSSIRDMYIESKALVSYQKLNRIGEHMKCGCFRL